MYQTCGEQPVAVETFAVLLRPIRDARLSHCSTATIGGRSPCCSGVANFLRQPILLQTSSTLVTSSARFNAIAICSSVNLVFLQS